MYNKDESSKGAGSVRVRLIL